MTDQAEKLAMFKSVAGTDDDATASRASRSSRPTAGMSAEYFQLKRLWVVLHVCSRPWVVGG